MDPYLVDQTAMATKESKEFVATCIRGVSSLVKKEIASGMMRNVRVPLFGLFYVDKVRMKGMAKSAEPKRIVKRGE